MSIKMKKDNMKFLFEEISHIYRFATKASEILNSDRGKTREGVLSADSYLEGIKMSTRMMKEILNDTGNER